ncbi:MAG: IscS subfamily cysteine desulfurase [Gemmataceae bacterium]
MTVKLPIYMDHHATTPVDPRVLEAMLPYFCERYGNPASKSHSFGWEAEQAVHQARRQVARLIGAEEREIIFTSGATESNNLAIKGVAWSYAHKGRHIVTAATEHRAVLDPCRRLQQQGFRLTVLPVDRYGVVDLEALQRALTPDTILVSIMAANNEVGTLQPLADISRLCRERGVLVHTDAAQAVGKISVDVNAWDVDLLSLSAHKMYGPKGVGALYVRRQPRRVRLEPLLDGGGHEFGLRSGTVPTPLVVGLGKACELCSQELPAEMIRLRALRDRLQAGLLANVPDIVVNGHPEQRLPHNLHVSFLHIKGEALLLALKDVALSAGSACTSAHPGPSHVLVAMGLDEEIAEASLRFGLGRFNTQEEVDWVVAHIAQEVRRLRSMSAVYAGAR